VEWISNGMLLILFGMMCLGLTGFGVGAPWRICGGAGKMRGVLRLRLSNDKQNKNGKSRSPAGMTNKKAMS
jgi:hypothetical protein